MGQEVGPNAVPSLSCSTALLERSTGHCENRNDRGWGGRGTLIRGGSFGGRANELGRKGQTGRNLGRDHH